MSNLESKKARVIETPKAHVVDSPTFFNKDRATQEAVDFAKQCRKLLKLSPQAALNNHHLQQITDMFGLNPLGFYHPPDRDHWMLATRYIYEARELHVYDPESGVKSLEYFPAQKIWFFPEPKVTKNNAADLSLSKYIIPDEPLKLLGPIQVNPVDCGPFTVFAAQFARRDIKS